MTAVSYTHLDVYKRQVVVDTRAGQFFDQIYETIEQIRKEGVECEILFLETSDDILIRRYKESRRKHPMDAVNISNGIVLERKKLSKLRDQAKYVIDTSVLSVRQLSDMLWGMFSSEAKNNEILPVIVSFGFTNGIPIDADLVFDVRFLPNPYYCLLYTSQTCGAIWRSSRTKTPKRRAIRLGSWSTARPWAGIRRARFLRS